MANNQAGEVALSWADSFIIDLLSEEEKYQDVIKDLTESAVMGAIASVAESSEEIAYGYLEAYHTATGTLDRASTEVNEGIDTEIFPAITTLTPPPKNVNDWIDEETFETRLADLAARYNATLDIDEKLDRFLGINEELWRGVGLDINEMQHDIDTIQNDFPGFIAEQTAGLLAIPFSFLFDRFMGAFFEEV